MTYNDLRKGRVSKVQHAYLVTAVTIDRRRYFEDLSAGRCVVQAMRAQDAAGRTATLAFVIMPDHVHWLFSLATEVPLAVVLKHMKGTSAHRVNALRNIVGPVWQASFHDHALRRDESLADVAHYVVMNPVRAGMVKHIGDYSLWDAVWDMSHLN